jgi:hypothetical protein
MHKSATKCNETLGKWCKNKHGASKIMDTLETYHRSRLRFFAGKLLSKWEGPYFIEEVYRSGAIKIASLKDDTTQVVNGQRLKHYIAGDSYIEDVDAIQTFSERIHPGQYARTCRVHFRICNSSSQKRFA